MAEIGVILELESSYNAAQDVIRSLDTDEMDITRVSDYQEGIAAAKRMVEDGAKVLVTRAGYIPHLRGADLKVPVIEIPFTMGNITQSCVEASRRYGCVGLAGTQYVIDQSRILDSVLGDNIKYYLASTPSDYQRVTQQARRDGVKALVGGFDETKYAESAGLARVVMASGSDEMAEALHESMKIVSQIRAEAKKGQELSTLFDMIGDALMLFDGAGNVVQLNHRACKILGVKSENQRGKPLTAGQLSASVQSVLSTGADLPYDLQECGGKKYVCSLRAVKSGGAVNAVVAKLQSVEYIQSVESSTRARLAERGLTAKYRFDKMIGDSPQLREAIRKAKRYSGVDSIVLITGESGTGKELFAQSIHNHSPRANGPFVAINCATLPASLLESELFGYSEGAFTGAKRGGKVGLFELAHNGTIFLDEIAEIGTPIQAQLLRVMEEKQIMRIGDDKIIPVNVRIIAATNKNLRKMVQQEKFREDLFYRINVLELHLPPVCEREGDARRLLEYLLESFAEKIGRPTLKVTPEAMQLLTEYRWPGNVREMANVAERLTVTNESGSIGRDEVLELLYYDYDEPPERQVPSEASDEDVARALAKCGGNKTAAAAMLNISRPTLYRRMRELGIK